MTNAEIKRILLEQSEEYIDDRVGLVQKMVNDAQEGANNETKSSAGDKFETGRAMMQLEKDKHSKQLSEALKVQMILSRIDPEKVCDRVEFGSVVVTDMGSYFIAISAGRIKVEGKSYYVISPQVDINTTLRKK